ncbi:MAG: carbohydrate binding domain-containing protein, partial [Nanoarchaeota archaeon]|nr:carbohydrate binding domain-containing protein [Nanoarchaeota archaeon]MBU1643966.1 carbohydrate binding domain-containing protein [Nanoarchaeota archaeon]
VSCVPEQSLTDEEIKAELAKLTPEERDALLKDLENENGALAGQAMAKRFSSVRPEVVAALVKASKEQQILEFTNCNDLFTLMDSKFLWSLDFEDLDDEGWIQGWSKPSLYGGKPLPFTSDPHFELDNTIKHSGQRSLKISSNSKSNYGIISLNVNGGAVRTIPGETYTISFWAKGNNVPTANLAIYQIAVKATPSGFNNTLPKADKFAYFPQGTYDWKKVVQNFTVLPDSDALFVNILFQDAAGTVWLDDIVVMPKKQYDSLPETTLEVETRTIEVAAPAHHYFLRDKPIQAKAVLRNQKGTTGTYTVKAELNYCGKILQQAQKTVSVSSYDRVDVPLMTIDPSGLEVGDYLLKVTMEQNNKIIDTVLYPVGLRLQPQSDFIFSIGKGVDLDPASVFARMDKYKSNKITPLFYGGEPSALAADAALSRNMPFIVRSVPNVNFPNKKLINGSDWSTYPLGLFDENMWLEAAQQIGSVVKRTSHFPAFFPLIFTSDDYVIHGGWDWADNIKNKFKQLTGINVPTPKEFEGQSYPPNVQVFNQLKGLVDSNEPWLAYNKFLSKDVMGGYNKEVNKAVIQANPNAKIGPISGGQAWPLYQTTGGLYPPYNFGENGFNKMLSYYAYLSYWRPEISYMYWNDISRMGNRNLPLYVMPDAVYSPDPSYYWNNFYLLLASGVDGLAYFIDQSIQGQPFPTNSATPEFWDAAKNEMGPVIEKFGSLFTKLEPAKRSVGLLSSFTTSTYSTSQPMLDLCAYNNLMMAHVDVEPVAEEEILSGNYPQYDAILLNGVDWLRNDVAQKLMSGTTGSKIILDKHSAVLLSGNYVQQLNNLEFVTNGYYGACAGTDPDYGKPDRLAAIRTEIDKIVPPTVIIDKDTVVSRKYSGGTSQYLWLVDVHTKDEYINLYQFTLTANSHGGFANLSNNQLTLMKAYLQNQGIYTSNTKVKVKVKTTTAVKVVDVLNGKVIPSTFANEWTSFQTEIGRLKGKLIAFYPVLPTAVLIDAPTSITSGTSAFLKASIFAGRNRISSPFPIYVELFDPNGKQHAYTRYAATDAQGEYQLPILIGTNAPKGIWKVQVTELSTGIKNSKTFNVN